MQKFILLCLATLVPRLAPASALIDRIDSLLVREDKVTLGGGQMVIWAPEFPHWLDHPGFWDHACFLEHRVERLFTVTVLDENLREIPLELASRRWQPSHLQRDYTTRVGLEVQEVDVLLPQDVLVASLTFRNQSDTALDLNVVQWTLQESAYNVKDDDPRSSPRARWLSDLTCDGKVVTWKFHRNRSDSAKPKVEMALAMGSDKAASSYNASYADNCVRDPLWRVTPFYEKMSPAGLPPTQKPPQKFPPGNVYLALHQRLHVPARAQVTVNFAFAIQPVDVNAGKVLRETLQAGSPLEQSRKNWDAFFKSVPEFWCSDPYFTRYYWYRWFGLRLNRVNTGGRFRLPHPCVFEGINAGWFRHNISYSAQCHMLEMRWAHNPDVAEGSLLNFVAHQRDDGSFPGAISTVVGEADPGFYHANWGRTVRALYRVHPDDQFLRQVYKPLVRYEQYFEDQRDPEASHLYDVINQGETGQEYQARYLFVDPKADQWIPIRLKGVDATVYIYELQKTLAWMAEKLGLPSDARTWRKKAKKTRRAILKLMWDPDSHFFADLKPGTWERSPYKPAVGFYPFMTDVAEKDHLSAVREHLLNPKEFWTPYPVPSSSLSDPYSNPYGEWKNKRLSCPWNGRSWLMTNSHVVDALAHAAQTLDPRLKGHAADLLRRAIRMLFVDGDPQRPTSYEYYNPVTGQAPFFRGTDDYMHSWIVDLIIRYVAGLQPQDGNEIVIDPLPLRLSDVVLKNVFVKGHRLSLEYHREGARKGLRVEVDGRVVITKPAFTKTRIRL